MKIAITRIPLLLAWPGSLLLAFLGGLWIADSEESANGSVSIVTPDRLPAAPSLLESALAPEEAKDPAVGARSAGIPETPGALSPEAMEALATEAFHHPSQLKRSLAFSKLLEGLNAENALSILETLQKFDADNDEWELFRYAWASVDPDAALEHALSLEGRQRRDALSDTVTGWASKEPAGAMAWVDALTDPDEQRRYRDHLIAGLADHDLALATDYVVKLAEQGDDRASRYIDTVAREQLRSGNLEGALSWSESLPEGPLRGRAMEEVAERYVQEDPAEAAAWATKYAEASYAIDVIEEIGDEWAERDPQAAIDWLQGLPAGPAQAEGMGSAVGEWAERDPMAASEFLVSLPNSPTKDAAVRGLARNIAREDPQAAIAWASTIGQEDMRLETLTASARAWYRQDRNAALAWIETSGLPPEAQTRILRNDRRD